MMKSLLSLLVVVGVMGCTVIESNRAGVPFLNSNGGVKRTFFQGSYSLPRKYVSYKVLANNRHFSQADHFSVTQAPTASVLVPDPSAAARFDVNYAPSRFSRDQVTFTMADQMLSTVSVSTKDETDDVLVNFAQAAAQIGRLSSGLTTKPRGGFTFDAPGAGSAGDAINKVVAHLSFDPTDVASVNRAKKRLGHYMNLRIEPAPRPITHVRGCNHSVCYRPLTTVLISFEEPHSGNSTDFVVQVPDPHQIAGIDLERSAFVDRQTTLTFSSGTLQKIDMTKPSELAQAALLPVRIIDAIFTGTGNAISGLLGLRQNETQGSIELLNAQAAYLNALVSYRTKLENAQNAGVDTARLNGTATASQSGPGSFATPGGQGRDPAKAEAAIETQAAGQGGAGTFGGTPTPAGGSGAGPSETPPDLKMTCTPETGCMFEVVDDG